MSPRRRLPRGARLALSRFLPARRAEDVAGDLEEVLSRGADDDGGRRRAPESRLARWLWAWKEVLSICIAYARRDRPGPGGPVPGRAPRHAVSGWLDAAARGARALWRSLVRDPATSAIAVATLALAVGAATAVLGLVDAVILEPLPFAEPERLYRIGAFNPDVADGEGGVSWPDLLDLEEGADGFEGIAGHYAYPAVMTGEDVPRQLTVGYTSLNFFSVLGVPPVAGHPYTAGPGDGLAPGDPAVNPRAVAVVSDAFWRRAFGADPGIVGRRILVDGQSRRILGVMPAGIGLPARDVDLWMPWSLDDQSRNDRFLGVVGRLGPEASPAGAVAGLRATAAGLAGRFPDTNAGWTVSIEPLRDFLLGDVERPMWILTAAVLLVLLVATANVAGLLLVRNWRREREVAVRRALGASSWTIGRGLLAESLTLSLLATAAGIGLGRLGLALLPAFHAALPVRTAPGSGGVVLATSVALAVLVGLSAGLTPALQAARRPPLAGLKSGGRTGAGRSQLRARAGLVAAEVALVTVLLVGAGLLLQSFARLTSVSAGLDATGVVAGRVELAPGSAATSGSRVDFFVRLLAELRSRTDVAAAGATTVLPMSTSGTDFNRPYWRAGEPNPGGRAPEADIRMVTPGYFSTLGIPLLAGRDFGPEDRFAPADFRDGRRVAVVNRSLAERTWPGAEAVGRRLVMDYPGRVREYDIVGVVGDVRYYGPRQEPRPEIYIPYAQNPYPGMSVVVRSSEDGGVRRLADELPGIVAGLDPAQPVHDVVALEDLVAGSVARDRLVTALLTGFGVLALAVAAAGVYGLVGSSVASRTRELGVRLALGATGAGLVRQVLLEAVRVAGAGGAAGIVAALWLSNALGALLYETDPADPLALLGVAAFLLAVIGLAAVVPACRVLRVDPGTALTSSSRAS